MSEQQSAPQPDRRPPESIIWTRRNIALFILVVALGALILAQLCFVGMLVASPTLRQRVFPDDKPGAMVLAVRGGDEYAEKTPSRGESLFKERLYPHITPNRAGERFVTPRPLMPPG